MKIRCRSRTHRCTVTSNRLKTAILLLRQMEQGKLVYWDDMDDDTDGPEAIKAMMEALGQP
jgi:hypothetical protein